MTAYISEFKGYLSSEKMVSANTLESYIRDINKYVEYLAKEKVENVLLVTNAAVSEYIDYLRNAGRSASTIARTIASVRSFYRFLLMKNLISYDPTANLKADKVDKKSPEILRYKRSVRPPPEKENHLKHTAVLCTVTPKWSKPTLPLKSEYLW